MTIEKKMTNCPKCQKPILNEGIFTSAAKFNMRCPWCQATLEVNIQPKIVTEIIKLANGEPYRSAENQENKPSFAHPLASSQPAAEFSGQGGKLKPQAFKLVGYLYPEEDNPKNE